MAVRSYDPESVIITWGSHEFVDFAEDSLVVISTDEQFWEYVTGAKGEGARSKVVQSSAEVELTLKHTSPSLRFLENEVQRDRNTGGVVKPFLMRDLNSGGKFAGPKCWIQERGDVERGNEIAEPSWTLKIHDFQPQYGAYPNA